MTLNEEPEVPGGREKGARLSADQLKGRSERLCQVWWIQPQRPRPQ